MNYTMLGKKLKKKKKKKRFKTHFYKKKKRFKTLFDKKKTTSTQYHGKNQN